MLWEWRGELQQGKLTSSCHRTHTGLKEDTAYRQKARQRQHADRKQDHVSPSPPPPPEGPSSCSSSRNPHVIVYEPLAKLGFCTIQPT